MRITTTVLAALVLAAPLAAQAGKDQTKSVAQTPPPAGWVMKLDPKDASKNAKMVTMGDGFHVTSGGAAIYYAPKDAQGKGDFTTMANFRQTAKGEHPEAFGLFAGGHDLDDVAKQSYYYFLVREDGQFLINHRAGHDVHKIVDWTPNAAIVKFGEKPGASNDLAIKVGADSVRFLVNNKTVHAISRKQITDISGQTGFRVNHNLDVHIGNYMAMKGGT